MPRALFALSLALLSAGCTPSALDSDGDGVEDADDCAPQDASIYPGADEGCDGLDSDCDGVVPGSELDGDGDGVAACEGDCAPADATLHPLDVDEDGVSSCDGDCDDGNAALHPLDADGDGVSSCDGDCDDTDSLRAPGRVEGSACDGVDEDCVVDPGEADADGDGALVCTGADCDDDDGTAWSGAPELCDSVDNDCNGITDDVPHQGALPQGDVSLEDDGVAWATLIGEVAWDSAGEWVTAPGDVNGDGYDDLLVSTNVYPEWAPDPWRPSRTYLVHGPVCGVASLALEPAGVSDAVFLGLADTSRVGDVNGDGLADVRIGPYIFFSPVEREMVPADADIRLVGFGVWDRRKPVEFGADLNGDGFGDLIVGDGAGGPERWHEEYGWLAGLGQVSVFFGPLVVGDLVLDAADIRIFDPISPLIGFPRGGIGWAVTSPGDLNGDGVDDLVIGAPRSLSATGAQRGGAVDVFYGPLSGVYDIEDSDATIRHTLGMMKLGSDLAGVGDIDGDGLPEFAVGGVAGAASGLLFTGVLGQHTEASAISVFPKGAAESGYSLAAVSPAIDGGFFLAASAFVPQPGGNPLTGLTLQSVVGARTLTTDRAGSARLAVGDLSGDGQADLIWASGSWVDAADASGQVLVIVASQ